MQDYRVELDAFSGPLDLLLYLVKRDEIDLMDFPVARLTEQYLLHVRMMQQIDVNVAGEFLVMAATLLEIKSAMLLPKAEVEQVDEPVAPTGPGADPRHELVQQLLAYKRFKDAALDLEARQEEWRARFARAAVPVKTEGAPGRGEGEERVSADEEDGSAAAAEIDLEDVHVMDLCTAFARIIESIGRASAGHQVIYDDTPMGLHADDILDRLGRDGSMTLQKIFEGRSRSEAIGLFLALLELVRQRKVRAVQESVTGPIQLEPVEEKDRGVEESLGAGDIDAATRWVDPGTGQVQYEWPSEEARVAAERRAKLRAGRAAGGWKKGKDQAEGGEEGPIVDLDGDGDAGDSKGENSKEGEPGL